MKEKFDYTENYNNTIKEKVEEIIKLCNRNDISVFMSFCVANDPEKGTTDYANEYLSPGQKNLELENDYFADFVNVLNGFRTVPHKETIFEDLDLGETNV